MMIVITTVEKIRDKHGFPTGETRLVASHGVDEETGKIIVLPQEHPAKLGACFDPQYNEYVIA